MRKREHNVFANAASLLLCGGLAGVVVAGAAFPVIALAGLAAKAGADTFAELPTSLDVPVPPQITYLYATDERTLLGTFYDENRHDIPLSEVPQVMRDAIIAAEDQRFYEHNGVDVQGVLRAFLANQTNEDNSQQGASTLTMQYVRQALTYGATNPADVLAATETTPERKIREIRLALGLEKRLTKDQILQNYLNIAAFGQGAYGIYAASQVYFGKEPKDLTLAEAALLAGLPKAPSDYNPATEEGQPKALERRDYVLTQMAGLGMISREQARVANASALEVVGARTPRDCIATTANHYGFFCDFFYRWWSEQDEFGRDAAERSYKLKSGGYRIISTLDVKAQASAHSNVEKQLKTGNRDALMLAAIEPGTGYVRAMAANRTFNNDDRQNGSHSDPAKRRQGIKGTFPRTTNPLLSGGGDISGYKAGSTFKLFTMLAAIEAGYPLNYTINTTNPYRSKYIVGTNDPSACADRRWCPKNAGSQAGPYNMWTGMGSSINTYFVPLIERVGADKAVDMAIRLGVHFRNDVDRLFTSRERRAGFGPFTLGVTDVVPLELANAYSTVAAEGVYCEPMPVRTLIDFDGNEVTEVVQPRCNQAISREVALAAADVLRCPIRMPGGLGRCRGSTAIFNTAQIVGKPVIGKTGTSDDNWTKSFIISTKQLTVATVVADPDKAEQPHGNWAAEAAQNSANSTLRDYMKGKPALNWDRPPSSMINGQQVRIPNVRCMSVEEATARIKAAGFDVFVGAATVASDCEVGTVATTDPEGSTSKGSAVSLILSSGPAAPPPSDPTDPGDPGGGGGGGGNGGPGGGDGGDDGGGGPGPGIILPPPWPQPF
jgi:membrane peptidoglycan carboxypeptidase